MVLQSKEVGAQVPFATGYELPLQTCVFRDDSFGAKGTQTSPATVSTIVRDAFFNGNLTDAQTQASGQGMTVPYMLITWNETQEVNGYIITDLVIGVVAQSTRDFNVSPSYLIDAVKAVGWIQNFIQTIGLSWMAYTLVSAKLSQAYNSWHETVVSEYVQVSARIDQPLPDLPTSDSIKQALLNRSTNLNTAIGAFTVDLLDKGHTPTILGYVVDVCFEKEPTIRPPAGYYWYYNYRVFVRYTLNFTATPDIVLNTASASKSYFVWTLVAILAVIKLVGLLAIGGAVAIIIAYNLTHQSSGYVKYDENGNVIETGYSEGPPDWWGIVIPVIALMGVGAGVYLVLPYFRKGSKK